MHCGDTHLGVAAHDEVAQLQDLVVDGRAVALLDDVVCCASLPLFHDSSRSRGNSHTLIHGHPGSTPIVGGAR